MQSIFSQDTVMMSQSSQQNAAKRARTMQQKAEGGIGASIGGNKVVAAQFNPGRGGEISWTKQNLLKAIKFKTGEPIGPPAHDAYEADRMMFGGQKMGHAFAFKAVLDASLVMGSDTVPTRYVVHNVFRHTNYQACGRNAAAKYRNNTLLWHNTLGPDASTIRQNPPFGSCFDESIPAAAGLKNDLVSPFRFPLNGAFMFSRLTRQNFENFMWNANPLKIGYITPNTGSAAALSTTDLQVYDNAIPDIGGTQFASLPWQQLASGVANPTAPATAYNSRGYYYKCQAGIGHVAYQFNNDGTGPLVVDIVITRCKKGHEADVENTLQASYATGYSNYMNAANFQADYGGQATQPTDCLFNARVEFLPAKALKWASPLGPTLTDQDVSKMYRQVARDQFIVSGGATRPWSFDLQSLNYNANDYAQPEYDPEFPSTKNVDDLSYIVSIGFSSLSIPLVENGTGSNVAVLDRMPQSINCSVTGNYTENPLPVYISKRTSTGNVQGSLEYPWYYDPDAAAPTLQGIDIANAGNIVRTNTAASALIQVGPLGLISGA